MMRWLALAAAVVACRAPAASTPPDTATEAKPPRALAEARSNPASSAPGRAFSPIDLPRIDTHTHIMPGALRRAIRLFADHKIVHVVNLSGGSPDHGLAESLAEARAVGHTTVFTYLDFREVLRGGAYGPRMAAKLKRAAQMGARGVKISKGLGLGYTTADDRLLPVDDKGLDAAFEMAGKLGLPIAIHTGDPKAFWRPPTPDNERFEELSVHPGWSFHNAPVSWEDLYGQFERRVARHPHTTFIGVHFGNDPEDPARVAQMLERHPNLMIDTAARVPEIGRVDANHDAARMRAFFERYQDRILFGTDVGVGQSEEDLMLGSTGATPPTAADVARFFDSTWRWFETDDKQIPTPTPIQGHWNVDGIGLPRAILEKVYFRNAMRIVGIELEGHPDQPEVKKQIP